MGRITAVNPVHKHREGRDVPRTMVKNGLADFLHQDRGGKRVKLGNGVTMQNRPADEAREPRRPAFCMILDDLVGEPVPGIFGMFPAALIPKLLPWLRCERRELLHLCSGCLPRGEGIRVDVRPEARPDVVADARALPFVDSSHAAALCDPPYSEHYARELYGTDYPRPCDVLREAVRVVRPNGRIGFVHHLVPNPPDGARFVRCFGLSMGFGYPMRAVTIFEKLQPSLFPGEAPVSPRQARRRAR